MIQQAADAVRSAEALLITAGAGMGVDSGLPDFRGNAGFWNAYPAYRHLGLSFAELANPGWFTRDPALAWGFYGHRFNLYASTSPHAGFAVLRKWAARMPLGSRVFTSNVDGHFQKAGFAETNVTEIHGSIHHLQSAGRCDAIWPAAGLTVSVDPETFRAAPPFPHCAACGGIARPNILMFGDFGWLPDRTATQEVLLRQWLATCAGKRLLVVELGAGLAIPTVRHQSETVARRPQVKLLRINVREPHVPCGHLALAMPAAEALLSIDAVLETSGQSAG